MDGTDSDSVLSPAPQSIYDDEMDYDNEIGLDEFDMPWVYPFFRPVVWEKEPRQLSRLEKLPPELLVQIAAYLPDDSSFKAFFSCCSVITLALLPLDSGVWRARFLSRYDYPIVEDIAEISIAYRLRQLVLDRVHWFSFKRPGTKEILVLESIRDLVVESYNPAPNSQPVIHSKNLKFLSTVPEPGFPFARFLIRPAIPWHVQTPCRPLFEALRLTLAFLFLNPSDRLQLVVGKPTNYEASRIYLFGVPFETLCKYAPGSPDPEINLSDLVHILNFFNNHLCNPAAGTRYREMALALAHQNRIARPWCKPLQQFDLVDIPQEWIGHYTCIHPVPEDHLTLGQKQSCAAGWTSCLPLAIDFSNFRDSKRWWPLIFRRVPAFQCTPYGDCRYLRGMAYYARTSVGQNDSAESKINTKYPHMMPIGTVNALTVLRARGMAHRLPDQEEIPGWSRMLFVLYMPSDLYLLNVLWTCFSSGGLSGDIPALPGDLLDELCFLRRLNIDHHQFQQQVQLQVQTGQSVPVPPPPPPIEAEDVQLLHERTMALFSKIELTAEQVARIEDDYQSPYDLQWNEIEYAYAYEGILTPGGRVVLGRFFMIDLVACWSHTIFHHGGGGGGNGSIINAFGVDITGIPENEIGVSRPDVGSFVFWADQ